MTSLAMRHAVVVQHRTRVCRAPAERPPVIPPEKHECRQQRCWMCHEMLQQQFGHTNIEHSIPEYLARQGCRHHSPSHSEYHGQGDGFIELHRMSTYLPPFRRPRANLSARRIVRRLQTGPVPIRSVQIRIPTPHYPESLTSVSRRKCGLGSSATPTPTIRPGTGASVPGCKLSSRRGVCT